MLKLLALITMFWAAPVVAQNIVYIPGSLTHVYDKDSISRNGDFATVTGGSTAVESKVITVVFDCSQARLRNPDGWVNIGNLPAEQAREASWLRNEACRSWKHPTSWFK